MPTNSRSERRPGIAVLAAGAAGFALLATLNAGGYRYGAADQAFYIPAILRQLDPALYPRDWAMIGAQGRYFLLDEVMALASRITGLTLPWLFLVAQAATLAALYAGAIGLGRAVLSSGWAMTAWVAALTLRHRITMTGVNTLEGYFHPRVLVCGLGLVSLALLMRGRPWWALGLAAASGVLHPTTAALFVAIVAVAVVVDRPATRRPVAALAAALIGLAAMGSWQGQAFFDVTRMDPDWRALVATKDYTFPTAWSIGTWATNLLGPAILVAAWWARRRAGALAPAERGLVIGALALVAGFLASLPFIAAGVALAVQLQTSRVFWPVELLATLYLVWWLVDAPAAPARRWAAGLAAALVVVATARGIYVGFLEHPGRPTVAVDLPDDDWTRALEWVATHTPRDAYVLADPGHAWKFGTAVRIGAGRDVFLEETKDVAMAMYSRAAAAEVRRKIDAVAGFDDLDAASLAALARREGLTLLVTARELDLPVLHAEGAVRVYRPGS
ncbi:MAG: hypothetical protein AB7U83_22320 [Vicinamibacterales bacterium]